jgi:GMP synthase-like glutamine amidotransferase
MKLLVIDNNIYPDCWGSEEIAEYGYNRTGGLTLVRRGPHDDLPKDPKAFDHIIISGSITSILDDAPWISNLEEFVKKTYAQNIPLLGVCYGHQIIARSLGGKEIVGKAKVPEIGWTEIFIVENSPIFEGLNSKFHSFSYHFDQVATLPKNFTLTARSKDCPIQSYKVEGKPIFGIQFHPEKKLAEENETLADLKKKKQEKQFLNPGKGKKLYSKEVGDKIFGNFFRIKT